MRFSSVEFPKEIGPAEFRFEAPPGTTLIASRQRPNFLTADRSASSGRAKPVLPTWIPPRFSLSEVDNLEIKGAHVLHARYTDGLEALSVFQMSEKVSVEEDAAGLLPGANTLEVRRGGRRYLLVGRISAEELGRIAKSIP